MHFAWEHVLAVWSSCRHGTGTGCAKLVGRPLLADFVSLTLPCFAAVYLIPQLDSPQRNNAAEGFARLLSAVSPVRQRNWGQVASGSTSSIPFS